MGRLRELLWSDAASDIYWPQSAAAQLPTMTTEGGDDKQLSLPRRSELGQLQVLAQLLHSSLTALCTWRQSTFRLSEGWWGPRSWQLAGLTSACIFWSWASERALRT